MSTSTLESEAIVRDVNVTDSHLDVDLSDGRRISIPLAWFPRLANASPADRSIWEPCAAGRGIHWPVIDEDLSIAGLLRGRPSS